MRQRLDCFAASVEPKLAGHPQVEARVRVALGAAYVDVGEMKEAETHLEHALAISRQLYGPVHPRVEDALHEWAWLIYQRGDYAAAAQQYREDLAMRQALLGNEHPKVAISLANLARTLDEKGDYDEAEQLHLEELQMLRKLKGDDHPDVALSLYNLAGSFAARGDWAAAVPLLQDALAIARKQPEFDEARGALLLHHLALCLDGIGNPAEALPHAQESIAIYRQQPERDDFEYAHALKVLAQVLCALREFDEAEKAARESVAIYRENESWPPHARNFHRDAVAILAKTLVDAGRPDEAILLWREFVDELRRLLPAGDVILAHTLARLGALLVDQERDAEAEPPLRECAAIYEQAVQPDSENYWWLASARSMLGEALAGQAATLIESDAPAAISKFTEAERQLVESANWLTRNADRIPQDRRAEKIRQSLQRTISLYESWDAVAPESGKADRAAEWRAEMQRLVGF